MNKFTASNGYRIVPVNDNQTVTWIQVHNKNPDPELSERHSLGLYSVDALREFFRAEEDERLGRWRWPEDPTYVVYPEGEAVRVLNERTGRDSYPIYRDTEPSHPARAAAHAYFDAHPEPKPWHDAKPGEVWMVTFSPPGGGGTEPWWVVDDADLGLRFKNPSYISMPFLRDTTITDARRIWPEGS